MKSFDRLSLPGSSKLPKDLKRLLIRVPGSSANLGPGFDALALAFNIYLHLELNLETEDSSSQSPLIVTSGRDSQLLPTDKSNLIYKQIANLLSGKSSESTTDAALPRTRAGSTSTDPADSTSTDPADSSSTDPAGSTSTDPEDSTSTDPADSTSTDPADSSSTDPADSSSTDPEGRKTVGSTGKISGDSICRDPETILSRLRLQIDSEIPLTRGLGSSAAALVASIYAGLSLSQWQEANLQDVLELSSQIEGHADNASASLFGGLTLCSVSDSDSKSKGNSKSDSDSDAKSQPTICKMNWPEQWRCLLVVPSYELSTSAARSVLPQTISREDAIFNLQKSAMLVAAVHNQNEELLKEALQDRLHQPYRMHLVPEFQVLSIFLKDYPVLGTVLSGAGPSILTIVNQRHKVQVLQALESWCRNGNSNCRVLDLEVDQEGLKLAYE